MERPLLHGRGLFLWTLILLAIFLQTGCASRTHGVARVGVVAPLSGESYLTGYRMLFAVRLAVREWNERGGVAGRRIELVALDDQGRAETARLQARALALDP